MLIVDNREPVTMQRAVLSAVPDASIQRLEHGDFVIVDHDGHSVGVERKATNDLLNSMTQQKLPRQLGNLSTYSKGILVVEGTWEIDDDGFIMVRHRKTGWRSNSVHMILWKLQNDLPIQMLWTSSRDETVRLLKTLNNRAEAGCVLKKVK